jgi:glycosyltransferase involved in cell wall biosynthesis
LAEGITKNGFLINPLDDLFKSRAHFSSIQLVHVNWFENLDESSKASMWKSFGRKIVVLLAIKASGKKLVWTMHNRLSHEKKSGDLSRILVKMILKSADAVVIHCAETETILREIYPQFRGKVLLIPHPHFIGIYGPMRTLPEMKQAPLELLFIGAVKPYKNLELLIRVCREFGDAVHLTIAGKPSTPAYAHELQGLATGADQINLKLGFVEDSEIAGLIDNSELLVLPYDLRSSLNSGTVILAFSYARTVICPRIGTIDELPEGQSELFTYTYDSELEHEQNLRHSIQNALEIKQKDPLRLLQMGRKMQAIVQKQNDPTIATDRLSALYRDLLA